MLRPGRLRAGASLSLSIAVHAALVLGLLTLFEGEPSENDRHVIDVNLTGFDTDSVARPDAAPTTETPTVAEEVAPVPEDAVPAAPEPLPPPEPAVPPEPSAAAERAPEPVETPTPGGEPQSSPPLERVALEVSRLAPPAPRPAPPPVVTTVEMATAHAELLTAEASSWADEIDAATLPSNTVLETPDGESLEVAFARELPQGDMGLEQVVATVTTTRNGTPLVAELRLTRLAFSSFAQLVDRWDPRVRIHDDEIDGRFHANSEIYIDHSRGVQPTFHGKVTTARGINTSSSERRVRRDEVFLGGLETRAERIGLPKELAPGGREHVHRFSEDTRIVFFGDGRYAHAPLEAEDAPAFGALPDAPLYLIADDDAELHVSGTVNGRVLVFSPEAVVITGDLVYAADPFSDTGADDYLGLASDRSVEIAPPSVTGRGDLRVQAAIYAKRRFAVRQYRNRNGGTLFIDGSVTAGSVTATEPRFGTKLRFDRRFEHTRPPGFPVTDRYELTASDAVWRIAR